MTDDTLPPVVPLRVISSVPEVTEEQLELDECNENVITMLEEMLEGARAGKWIGLMAVIEAQDGYQVAITNGLDIRSRLGTLEIIKHHMLRVQNGGE